MGRSSSKVTKIEGGESDGDLTGVSPSHRAEGECVSRGTVKLDKARASGVSADAHRHLSTRYGNLCPRTTEWFKARNESTLNVAIAFVPYIIMQSFFESSVEQRDNIVAHRGEGAVVFSDASGFTALTERLAVKPNGAELLSQCLTSFFTPLIDIISNYRGDVIKFSGDALTIYFPPFDDTKHPCYNSVVPPHGTYGLRDLGPMATAVLRASACCIEIHRKLHLFETGVDGVVLCLHIGVGCGPVTVLQVGGIVPPETKHPRYEYVIAGPAIEQISIAEPLASNGETCLSPQAWRFAADWAVEGRSLANEMPPACDFHILQNLNASKYTFPCVRNAAMTRDTRDEHRFRLSELRVIRRYIPSNVFKQIENNTLVYVNEMRTVSTIFLSGSGVDVSTDSGAQIAQELMSDIQRVCYTYEGSLNKYLVDDKGMLFLLVYGFPPMVHTDDPIRAVLACMDFVDVFKRLKLVCRCGVTTGRNYCGVVGSAKRMEYTVLGDTVNLAARLMANASTNSILVDEATSLFSSSEISCKALPAIKVKGKTCPIPIFEPEPPKTKTAGGLLGDRTVCFPWKCLSKSLGGNSLLGELDDWKERAVLQTLLEGPRRRGGLVVISGGIGMGKTELLEHAVMDTFHRLGSVPIFSTQENRPGSKFRPIQELLRSIVLAFRHINQGLPNDEKGALRSIADTEFRDFVDDLRGDLSLSSSRMWYRQHGEEQHSCNLGMELAQKLLRRLVEEHPVTCALSLPSGSNMFISNSSEEETVLWRLAEQLSEMADQNPGRNPMFVVLSMQNKIDDCPERISRLISREAYIEISPLSETCVIDYIGKYVGLSGDMVPEEVCAFIAMMTQGNALFISETLDRLLTDGHIAVLKDSSGSPNDLSYTQELANINIADWTQTSMVGGTMCMLESLEPLQSAVVKMATVFNGVFTVADLAASTCSRWAGAHFFDAFRLFFALTMLTRRGIIERSDSAQGAEFLIDKTTDCFRLNNMLIRKVGHALVLEAQRKIVKRQALIDRVLARFLPIQMEDLRRRKAIPHIPWYYQIDQSEVNRPKA
eukprot:TRINITY_DN22692_c0_g2_i1.p1 TRINITY_DN22692_c0_g2~~TRINITY_DN22692_c0_g2_i1.p1  ORF type:complete len:1053 (-),score=155.09 TRINITY_DN22692_c0_g2_i1:497-3655(-)